MDKLYMALAEVGKECHFDALCYSLDITSLNALEEYNTQDSTVLDSGEINMIKSSLEHKYLNFRDLAQVQCVHTCMILNVVFNVTKTVDTC